MKIIGEKLRIARQIRNKTITQLAKEVEISKQSISQFEAETAEPKGETIFKISRILDFPIQFFTIANKESICVSHTFFRALSSTSALEKNSYIEKQHEFKMDYFNFNNIEVTFGVNQEDCSIILQRFFKTLRKK